MSSQQWFPSVHPLCPSIPPPAMVPQPAVLLPAADGMPAMLMPLVPTHPPSHGIVAQPLVNNVLVAQPVGVPMAPVTAEIISPPPPPAVSLQQSQLQPPTDRPQAQPRDTPGFPEKLFSYV